MASIQEIRQQYPQYEDMSDEQLAKALHRKFYSDMDFADFSKRIGFSAGPDEETRRGVVEELGRQLGLTGRYIVEGPLSIPAMVAQPIADVGDLILEQMGSDFRFGNQAAGVSSLLTDAGAPLPETATERVVGDASRALTAGGAVTGTAQRIASPVAQTLAASPGLQAAADVVGGASGGVARESGASPGGQVAASLAGAIATPLTIQGGVNAVRRATDPASRAVSSGVDNLNQLRGRRTPGMVEEYGGEALSAEAQKRLRSAQRMGAQITPAEASGDPILAARQGSLGTSDKGARELIEFSNVRANQQRQAIDSLLDDLSPAGESAAAEIRRTAAKILKEQQDALSAQAKPLYDEAYKAKLAPEQIASLMDDPVLAATAKTVQANPIYQKALKGAGPDTLRFWDITKRELDDKIAAYIDGKERQKAGLAGDSKSLLTATLDEISSDYAAARAIYGEGARPLQLLREGTVGRISALKDPQLKSVSRILFDPTETNPKVLDQLRQRFVKENPDAWRRIIRNELERRLDSQKSGRTGSSFYNAILAKDRDFGMFMNATRGLPDVQRTLIDMRRVWKDIINPESVKGAAGKAKSSLDVPRSTMEAGITWMKNMLGGRADTAAVRFITDPEWADDVARIAKIKDQATREREIIRALQAVSQTLPAASVAVSGPGSSEYQQ